MQFKNTKLSFPLTGYQIYCGGFTGSMTLLGIGNLYYAVKLAYNKTHSLSEFCLVTYCLGVLLNL